MKELYKSSLKFIQSQEKIPGGVNSPARAFKAVGGTPPFIRKAKGARMWDIDGNEYIDYVGSWGPMILGHAHPLVVDVVKKQMEQGSSYGAPTEIELEMAKLITDLVPSIDMIRMVNSGTEATMSAIRLARGFTQREKIIKFRGCYHGHSDMLLSDAGSGVATLGIPGSPGVPQGAVLNTLTLPYNDLDAVTAIFDEYPEEIAAVIVEPVAGNMGVVLPQQSFLHGLRTLTEKYGTVLIFDEVMTGFRLHIGGAQALFDVSPDLTCLGKIVGGGFPVGAYGGKRKIMEYMAPVGPVYQAGTLSGNPVAMQAGYQTLKYLQEHPESYAQLETKGKTVAYGLNQAAQKLGIPATINSIGSMFCFYFTEQEVFNYEMAQKSDTGAFKLFYHAMLEQGIYLPPSQFESSFISLAHTENDLTRTIECAEKALEKVRFS